MAQKTPQDHKPSDGSYTFTVKGKKHVLPKMGEDSAATIPGEITYAAVMNPDDEMTQMRLAFASLEAANPSPTALAALKSLPTKEMLEHVGAWMGGSSGSSA